ncbi:hypothetical protein QFZ52_002152 [Arthrobacter woluwensis]|uniref:DUF3592 domain-containing protein n=1 Tax=Arthrobacter woluwensis TaxID=156980 RepID=UPI002785E935|nr:DUF3592 domain-containing protein [Arthrobacter woluwensis]MDQ0709500.1 hypothetical protein [Arthrobacter woluwensis]
MSTVQIIAWSIWGAFVVLMVVVSVVQMFALRRRERGMREWPHVQAVVVGHKLGPGVGDGTDGRVRYFPIYQYQGPEGRVLQGRGLRGGPTPYPLGSALEICVNPQKPSESYVIEKTSKAMLGCTMVFAGVFLIGSFFFLRILLG